MKIVEVITGLTLLDEIFISSDATCYEVLKEGKWVSGRFTKNIRIDQPTYGAGQTHAHILGRRGEELGVINLDGTASHGTKMVITQQDAEALKARGFGIPPCRVVEWIRLINRQEALYG
jgi:hypothetical protein